MNSITNSTAAMSCSDPRHLRSDDFRQSLFDKYNKQRQQRKRNKVKKFNSGIKPEKKPELYDAKGVHIKTGLDLCDCLDVNCDGCFFKCPNKKCGSNKCGPDCRQKRKFYYESIEDPIYGTKRTNDVVIKAETSSDAIHIC